MRATVLSTVPDHDMLAEAVDVYAAAFARAPYHEGPDQADAFWERVERYAAERDGFRLAAVSGEMERVDAIGLAVLARPGDWWRDQVAKVLGRRAADEYLGEVCLEVVHIAVRPSMQRSGLGRFVHDLLLAGSPAPRGVLACHPDAPAPQAMYAARGWAEIGRLPVRQEAEEDEEEAEAQEPYVLMGRTL